MADGRAKVKLGEHEYVVIPQRIGYLSNRFGEDLGEVLQAVSDDNVGRLLGRQAHAILTKLLPGAGFMPEYEFMGFATQEALEAGDYDESYDKSPTPDEVFAAVQKVARVNLGDGFDYLKALGGMLGQQLKEALAAYLVAELSSRQQQSSPQPNGASRQTDSGTSERTPAGIDA